MRTATAPQNLEGKTVRFHFSTGPMKGKTFDHTFNRDGTVEWGAPDGDKTKNGNAAIAKVADNVFVGSYMSDKGNTLTTTMNLETGKLVAFASDGKQWSRHDGTVEVVA